MSEVVPFPRRKMPRVDQSDFVSVSGQLAIIAVQPRCAKNMKFALQQETNPL